MLDREIKVDELYVLEHKHNDNPNSGHVYERDLLTRSVSPVLLRNPKLAWFVDKLQGLLVVMVDSTQELRNLFNYNVDKYYDGHDR